MFLGVLFVLCLLSVPLCGGRLGAIGELRLRATGVIGAAVAIQVVIISVVPHGAPALHHAIHLSTYALAAAFAWLNRRVPGLALAAVGGAANLAAIAANGGVMPARAGALRIAGMEEAKGGFQNSVAVRDAHLAWLGDVFALPASWPIHNVFSIGDVLLVLGVLGGLHVVCGSRVARRLGLQPVTVTGVQRVDTGTAKTLIRVATVPHRGMLPGDLLVGTERYAPLPGSGATAGYGVQDASLPLALALPNGTTLELDRHASTRVWAPLGSPRLAPMEPS